MGDFEDLQRCFVGAVTVGERGQVVVPAEARERCQIQAGDKLLVMLHPSETAVIFVKLEAMAQLAQQVQELAARLHENPEALTEEG